MSLVSIGIVTWNSVPDLRRCLESVRRQTHSECELIVVDNASTDGTRELIAGLTSLDERLLLDRNTGFAAGHNRAIARSHGTYYVSLNPDVFLAPDFLANMVAALERDRSAGSGSGKLLRADGGITIDSTGIYLVPSQRHLDRGAGEMDRGQFDRPAYVFGASGAAAVYRREMLDDVSIAGEIFDEDFFAYREDADLAWRAQLLGWRCLYVPAAVAWHVRRVTPEWRKRLPGDINRYSVRNRFLLRLKNQPVRQALRFIRPALLRDLQVVGYVLLCERSSAAGLADVVRLIPRTWRKRLAIMRRRRTGAEIDRWFWQQAEGLERG